MRGAVDLKGRLARAALLRRAPMWVAGLLPWLVLRQPLGGIVWLLLCAADAAMLVRTVGRRWLRWLDDEVPALEDSSALLVEATSPLAQLQRQRLLARLDDSLGTADMRRIAGARVPRGFGWAALGAAVAAATWLFGSGLRGDAAPDVARALTPAAVPAKPELLVRVTPPKYTGVAAFESAPRDLVVPENTQVEWCQKGAGKLDDPIELGTGQQLKPEAGCARMAASESVLWRWRGARYSLRVTPDAPPEVTISAPTQMVFELPMDAKSATIAVSVRDDYRVQRATLHLTLARGSGENIRFTDREMPLPASPDPKLRAWSKQWALADLGMEPGDELYFFVRGTDNALQPHTVQSPTYTLRLPAPVEATDEQGAALPMLVKPESLRSQRQIIIDTEQLVADMRASKVSAAAARERSQKIASDQGALRRRYGQFLGEESSLFGGEEHDDDHGGEEKQDVLHQFGHAHDEAENATLFDEATKKVLRRALAAMWDAERELRVIEPKKALPPEYKALEAIKELQQADRIYLHKTAFTPPPIKEEKRMTGDVVGTASYKRPQGEANGQVPQEVRELILALSGDGALPALWSRTAHDWVRERIGADEQRLAAQRAIQDVADGCVPCRGVLRAWLRGGIASAPVLLQATPVAETAFTRAWRGGGAK